MHISQAHFLYQLVKADLLVCMPAPGDGIQIESDGFRKPARVYMLDIPTPAKQSKTVTPAKKSHKGTNI